MEIVTIETPELGDRSYVAAPVAGPSCSAGGSSGATESTIAEEKRVNVALTESDEERFVAELLAGLTAYPAYYVHMRGRNAAGPTAADLSLPAPVDPDEVAKRIAAGEWVVDLRDRTAYAAEHLAASLAGRTEVRGYPRRSFSNLPPKTTPPSSSTMKGPAAPSLGRRTSRCTACPTASTRSRRTGCGCIVASGFRASIAPSLLDRAGRATCSSTTNGSTPLKPDCASSELPDDQPPSVTCQHPHGSSSSAAAPPGRVR